MLTYTFNVGLIERKPYLFSFHLSPKRHIDQLMAAYIFLCCVCFFYIEFNLMNNEGDRWKSLRSIIFMYIETGNSQIAFVLVFDWRMCYFYITFTLKVKISFLGVGIPFILFRISLFLYVF